MRFGVTIANFGPFGDAATLAGLARAAEAAGWDGCFVWDHIRSYGDETPLADAWIATTAMALATERIRIGPLVTPLPRRRPWQVARQAVTVDHLSGGRLVLGVGIGGDWHKEYSGFGEDPDPKRHGAMLDEALAVIAGLWSGDPFSFAGEHYRVGEVRFRPGPLQRPRVPIWVAGLWPRRPPFRRAARWDGVFAIAEREGFAADAEDVRALRAFVAEHRATDEPFDVVVQAETRGRSPDALEAEIAALAAAGATWWLNNVNPGDSIDETRAMVDAGPPVLWLR